ncbi:MAG TPA: hypothetical protein VMM38_09630 [Aridibacter sp.]|nr:hypothetical protein [Aridibacter sp.]
MATIDRMNIRYEGETGNTPDIYNKRCFNVTKPVGSGQVNEFGDVLVVQALFDFLGSDENPNRDMLKILEIKLAKVTGFFDNDTAKMILRFQRGGGYRSLSTISADGIVHPASLAGRVLRAGARQMTIVQLNREAAWGASAKHAHDLVSTMLAKYPMLKGVANDNTGGKAGPIKLPV